MQRVLRIAARRMWRVRAHPGPLGILRQSRGDGVGDGFTFPAERAWCQDAEHAMRRAIEEGAPLEDVRITAEVNVPCRRPAASARPRP